MKIFIKKNMIFLLLVIILISYFFIIKIQNENQKSKTEFGVTFSKKRAEGFGLDWQQSYLSILDDLKVKKIRISAYWDEIEKETGKYNFSFLDWQINEAEKRGAQIILAVGQRLPGWPECHLPDWTKDVSPEKKDKALYLFIKETVLRYKNKDFIKNWQIENEPFLKVFGLCQPIDLKFFEKEINLVKSLDYRPVIISESGELSTWLNGAKYGDVLGITIYRTTWNKYLGYFTYPFPPASYFLKGEIVKFLSKVKKIICVEFQAEPWASEPLKDVPLEKQLKLMNDKKLKELVNYAQKAGFKEYYFWGVEWWFWLKENGNNLIWQEAKNIWQ